MKVIALLSGGLDSTALVYALKAWGHDVTGFFADYGQRAAWSEAAAARMIAQRIGIKLICEFIDLPVGSALQSSAALPDAPADDPSQRVTVVPARNTVLLAHATAHAIQRGARAVAYGATASDGAVYPDCRFDFVCRFRDLLNVATEGEVVIMAPWVEKSKREVVTYAREIGVPIDLTWSCYGDAPEPCGKCGACRGREEALAA